MPSLENMLWSHNTKNSTLLLKVVLVLVLIMLLTCSVIQTPAEKLMTFFWVETPITIKVKPRRLKGRRSIYKIWHYLSLEIMFQQWAVSQLRKFNFQGKYWALNINISKLCCSEYLFKNSEVDRYQIPNISLLILEQELISCEVSGLYLATDFLYFPSLRKMKR